jgi:eukaryotic-like serine/threonine-protein kinase
MTSLGHPSFEDLPFNEAQSLDSTKPFVPQGTTLPDQSNAKATIQRVGSLPEWIGRFQIEKKLGSGGFATVYLGYDKELERRVAVKVPHSGRWSDEDEVSQYLKEARILASLDHEHIVPVFDVGKTVDGLFYVVSKFIEGSDLTGRVAQRLLTPVECVEIIAPIAEALHFAHCSGLVHRDVKPANILLDGTGKPYLADFGIALQEQDFAREPENNVVGTPAYMSPEQARGEGHLINGRSDVFSLGIVLYELLTGVNPFAGANWAASIFKITVVEPKPPRQIDATLSEELERICLKALSKRASDRYATARDFADDLRTFVRDTAAAAGSKPVSIETPSPGSGTSGADFKIVPRGLRSFEAADADFFLELLPGPRDRCGLPEAVRFWKSRVEQTDPECTFRVGVIYGPSGCGKSSLVKAALIPRLAEHIVCVYVEVSSEGTVARLLHALRKRFRGLPTDLNLKDTMAALRRNQAIRSGGKLIIILDQFEQWLHAGQNDANEDLVESLRQCDGGHVQCVLMVRDDFWLGVSRFLRELEIPLLEGQNSALVDLFDTDHSKKVLAALGRAFERLPPMPGQMTRDQQQFLDQAVAGLSQGGKIVCVQLTLFAEMMKSRPWTPAALKDVGGTGGIGTLFLEETFSTSTAPPEHRYHEQAARAILKTLLPQSGGDIRVARRTSAELLDASGYAARPSDFDALLRMLDGELRLITPCDMEEPGTSPNGTDMSSGQRRYQLTHDYLVPSLRGWLGRRQRETRRGRAELRLAERTALWSAKMDNRLLPALWDYLSIRLLTDRVAWTGQERKMMAKAGRVHGFRYGIVACVAVVLALSAAAVSRRIEEKRRATHAADLVDQLVAADISQVPVVVQKFGDERAWVEPLLDEEYAGAADGTPGKLHAAVAMVSVETDKIDYLRKQLPGVSTQQFPIVRDVLLPYKSKVVGPLWDVALNPQLETQRRFQAAAALAAYSPDDQRWGRVNAFVADRLVSLDASGLVIWRDALRPAKRQLIDPLAVIYRDTVQREQVRSFAAETLADFTIDHPEELFNLLADAERFQFQPLFDRLGTQKEKFVDWASQELKKRLPTWTGENQKESLSKRQANIAVALYRLGHPGDDFWQALKFRPDPRVRSDVIHALGPLGATPDGIIRRLDEEPDVTIRRALVLTLGEFSEKQLPEAQRQPLIGKLFAIYKNAPDAGLHGAAEWLLRKWGQAKRLEAVNEELKTTETRLQARKATDKAWYINGQNQAYAIVQSHAFWIGSPLTEPGRHPNEYQHLRRIARRFAIAMHEVTTNNYREFQHSVKVFDLVGNYQIRQVAKTEDSPQTAVTWYEATQYCNWLSEREGIPRDQWCYEPNSHGNYQAGMRAKANHLELTGYRLPTETEWEFACRAETTTSRYYGLSEKLLPQYARYMANCENHAWPVGGLKPNDFGLFDTLGNAVEWCFDPYMEYPATPLWSVKDAPSTGRIDDASARPLRGAPFLSHPGLIRAAYRSNGRPNDRDLCVGFRPVRTFLW